MKKSKTKSILACAVLASVMAVGNMVWAADATKTWGHSNNEASEDFSTAFGLNTYATGYDATAWGYETHANGYFSTAWGGGGGGTSGGSAYGKASTAWGIKTIAGIENDSSAGTAATAFGYQTTASGEASTAWGRGSTASGLYSTAWGGSTSATDFYSTAWGAGSTASGTYSTAWGYVTKANGETSTAFGDSSKAGGKNSLAALGGTTGSWTYDKLGQVWNYVSSPTDANSGENAIAMGVGAVALAKNSVAIGQYAVTTMTGAITNTDKKTITNEFAVGGGTKDNYTYYSRITGVADGVSAHDAVNKGQLDAAVAAGGSKVELKSGETNLTLDDGTGTDAGKKILSLSSAPTFTGTVTAGSFKIDDDNLWNTTDGLKAAKVTVGNVVISNNKITGLADGTISNTSTDAVNGKQLYTEQEARKTATNMGSTAGKNYSANADVVTAVGKLDTALGKYNGTDVKGTYAKTSTVAGDMLALDTQVKANTDAIGDNTKGLTKDVTAIKTYVTSSGLDANNKKITKVANGEAATDAANMSQVVTQVGDNLTLDNATGTGAVGKKITLNDNILLTNAGSFGIKDASSGKVVTINKDGIVAPMYKVNDTNLWDATNGLKATTGKFGNVVTISATGIAMGSKKITGLANGTDATDAVNKGQLDAAVAGLSDVMSTSDSKLVADGKVEKSGTNDKEGHIVTGATVYDAMYSAVGDAFTGANGSKGLKYDATNSKLVANVAFEGTSATFSGSLNIKGATEGYAVTIDKDGIVAPAYKVGTATYIDSNGLNANSKVIKNVADGSVASGSKEAVNGGQLYTEQQARIAATTFGAAGQNYLQTDNVAQAVTKLDTVLGKYDTTTVNGTYANTGVVATDVKKLDTQVKTNTDAIAAINNTSTGVLAQAKTYTDNLASGQVTTNKTDIATLKTTVGDASSGLIKTVEDNRNTLQGQIDSIKSTGDKLGVYYENNEHTSITLRPTDGTVIHNLKAGTAAMDAVNVKQLNDAITERLGEKSNSTGEQAMALGPSNTVEGDNSTAVGSKNIVKGEASGAFGDPNIVYGDDSYAAGNENIIGVIANPSGVSVDAEGNITGISDTDKKVNHAYAFGYGNKITADQGLAFGNNNVVSGAGGVAIGNGATASADNSVALGNGSVADVENTVSVGAKGAERKIVNVAEGNIAEGSTDAVNGGQLYEAKQEIAGNIQNEVNTINNNLDRMGTRINKVGAGAAALAAMHPVYDEDSKLTFSAGLGSYRNEQAAAVGMFYRFSPRVMMNAGATVGNDNNMYNVGLNFALDRHVRGGLPSKAVMAKQLSAMSEENVQLKNKVANMEEQMIKMLAMIEELKNR